MAPEVCPNCGYLVPAQARSCPDCGADEQTGWNEDASAQRLGVPDDSFDHDEFVRNEFGERSPGIKPKGIAWGWWLVGVGVLAGFLWLSLVARNR